jgi:hypothetical protein
LIDTRTALFEWYFIEPTFERQDTYLGRRTVDPATAKALEGLLDKPANPKTGDKPGR